jgi:hypothetical protein
MKKNSKINKAVDFIEYISKNMEKEDLFLLYRINNVKRERLELYYDFIYSLNNLIIKTYLGDDITLGGDKEKHFNWCWKNVTNSFKLEGIYFLETDELYNYFLSFYQECFYEEDKEIDKVGSIEFFWGDLLQYDKIKTMSEYETLIELYKIFDKSFVVN